MKSIFALCITVLFLQGSLASGQEAPAKIRVRANL